MNHQLLILTCSKTNTKENDRQFEFSSKSRHDDKVKILAQQITWQPGLYIKSFLKCTIERTFFPLPFLSCYLFEYIKRCVR